MMFRASEPAVKRECDGSKERISGKSRGFSAECFWSALDIWIVRVSAAHFFEKNKKRALTISVRLTFSGQWKSSTTHPRIDLNGSTSSARSIARSGRLARSGAFILTTLVALSLVPWDEPRWTKTGSFLDLGCSVGKSS